MRGLLRRHGEAVDLVVAGLLALLAQWEIWFGTGAGHHRLEYAILTPLMAAIMAARRRYPTAVGTAAGLLSIGAADLWGSPDLLSFAVAWTASMYGLAVWSGSRRFLIAVAAFGISLIASAALGRSEPGEVEFALGWLVLLVLARYVVGDREQRLRVAELQRELATRDALIEERA